jgi:hypothetical protein
LAVYLAVLLAAVKPLGLYLAKLMEAPRWAPPIADLRMLICAGMSSNRRAASDSPVCAVNSSKA